MNSMTRCIKNLLWLQRGVYNIFVHAVILPISLVLQYAHTTTRRVNGIMVTVAHVQLTSGSIPDLKTGSKGIMHKCVVHFLQQRTEQHFINRKKNRVNLEHVRTWAREGGEIALHYYNAVEAQRKPDRSFVTAADVEIEALLRKRIAATYPNHGILGEEDRPQHTDREFVWALDPIDGTGAFVDGIPIWGISIGLLRYSQPVLGCFYMPALDEWYEADLEGPALFNGQPIQVRTDDLLDSEAAICVPSNAHRRYTIDYPGKARSLGSTAAYMCYVARGKAVGALLGWPKLWDIAASMAILQRAGGDARLLFSNAPLDLLPMLSGKYAPEPVVVGSPPALDLLVERIRVRSQEKGDR
jgi:myo-inositol-1(or 4)-monophosphatase